MNRPFKAVLSLAMAFALVLSLGGAAFADTWYIEKGDITVNADTSGQTVSQGGADAVPDESPVITGTSETDNTSSTPANTVTINVSDGATANVTFDNLTIDAGDTPGAAVSVNGNGNANIELDNTTELISGQNHAGLEKNNSGTLTITDDSGKAGTLNAIGGEGGAGIGTGINGDAEELKDFGITASDITITGGNITANGGSDAAGIGGGNFGDAENITITGGTVTANGAGGGAGIGGGSGANVGGNAKNITITGGDVTANGWNSDDASFNSAYGGAGIGSGAAGNAESIHITGGEVEAKGGVGAAGIGGGSGVIRNEGDESQDKSAGTVSNIMISGSARVTATAGAAVKTHAGDKKLNNGAAIGTGGDPYRADNNGKPGVELDTNALTGKLTPFGSVTLNYADNTSDTIVGTYIPPVIEKDTPASHSPSESLPARYYVLRGNNQTRLADSEDGLEFTLNSDNVIKVLIDGEEVEFEINENGDILISAEVLNNLPIGEHEIEFIFADGSCKAVFTVK